MWRILSTASPKLAQRLCIATSRHIEVTRSSSSLLFLPRTSSSCRLNARSFEAGNVHLQLGSSVRRDSQRLFASIPIIKQRYPIGKNKKKKKETQLQNNSCIVEFGKNYDWNGILDLYKKEKKQFNHINYATSMSQLGRMKYLKKDDSRLEEMMIDMAIHLQKSKTGPWDAQGMANVLHAVAKMQLKSNGAKQLTDSILGESNLKILLEKGNNQEIANAAWACATMGVECPSLFKSIDSIAFYLVKNGEPQAVANTAWACATMGVECPSLFKAINSNALNLVEISNPQAIANMAWACATLAIKCPLFFKAIEINALNLVQNGNSQNVANTAWACAILGVQCPLLFKAIDNNAFDLVQKGTIKDIADIARASVKLGVDCPSLFKAINNNPLYLAEK